MLDLAPSGKLKLGEVGAVRKRFDRDRTRKRLTRRLNMTVGELIELLQQFPPELPVFVCPDAEGRIAISPRDAVMNLVHPGRSEVISDDDDSPYVPDGFVDSLVIYPRNVRE